jgi:nucleotide-binding universal stress UspA family protein
MLGSDPMFRHLLVPTDGSDLAEGTIQRAVELARQLGARISFVHARQNGWLRPEVGFYGDPLAFDPAMAERFSRAAEDYSLAVLARARVLAEQAGVPCTTIAAANPLIYAAIVETAASQGCDLIVMASHGRRGLAGLLLGSETQRVLVHSALPVLVDRIGKDSPEGGGMIAAK